MTYGLMDNGVFETLETTEEREFGNWILGDGLYLNWAFNKSIKMSIEPFIEHRITMIGNDR